MAFGVRAVAGTRAHAAARHARDATALAGFFVAFAFCAVVLDTVHSLTTMGTGLDTALTVLEDGGELVSMSPAVAFAYAIARREPTSAPVAPGVA